MDHKKGRCEGWAIRRDRRNARRMDHEEGQEDRVEDKGGRGRKARGMDHEDG